jgi:hypothetical protein
MAEVAVPVFASEISIGALAQSITQHDFCLLPATVFPSGCPAELVGAALNRALEKVGIRFDEPEVGVQALAAFAMSRSLTRALATAGYQVLVPQYDHEAFEGRQIVFTKAGSTIAGDEVATEKDQKALLARMKEQAPALYARVMSGAIAFVTKNEALDAISGVEKVFSTFAGVFSSNIATVMAEEKNEETSGSGARAAARTVARVTSREGGAVFSSNGVRAATIEQIKAFAFQQFLISLAKWMPGMAQHDRRERAEERRTEKERQKIEERQDDLKREIEKREITKSEKRKEKVVADEGAEQKRTALSVNESSAQQERSQISRYESRIRSGESAPPPGPAIEKE